MSNWIRKFQKRKSNLPRKGLGTRGQRKGVAKMGMTMPPPKPKPKEKTGAE